MATQEAVNQAVTVLRRWENADQPRFYLPKHERAAWDALMEATVRAIRALTVKSCASCGVRPGNTHGHGFLCDSCREG